MNNERQGDPNAQNFQASGAQEREKEVNPPVYFTEPEIMQLENDILQETPHAYFTLSSLELRLAASQLDSGNPTAGETHIVRALGFSKIGKMLQTAQNEFIQTTESSNQELPQDKGNITSIASETVLEENTTSLISTHQTKLADTEDNPKKYWRVAWASMSGRSFTNPMIKSKEYEAIFDKAAKGTALTSNEQQKYDDIKKIPFFEELTDQEIAWFAGRNDTQEALEAYHRIGVNPRIYVKLPQTVPVPIELAPHINGQTDITSNTDGIIDQASQPRKKERKQKLTDLTNNQLAVLDAYFLGEPNGELTYVTWRDIAKVFFASDLAKAESNEEFHNIVTAKIGILKRQISLSIPKIRKYIQSDDNNAERFPNVSKFLNNLKLNPNYVKLDNQLLNDLIEGRVTRNGLVNQLREKNENQ